MADERIDRGIATLRAYRREWLRPDVMAGVTIAAYLVPQVMAYAQLAGLPPVVGLWSAVLPAVVFGLLTTSRHISMGPESTTAVMVVAAVGPLAAGDPVRFAALAATLAGLVGVVCLIAGLLRLGFLGDLLSQPILVGYMAGVAVLMVLSQLGRLTGIEPSADGLLPGLIETLGRLGDVHLPTLAVGSGVVAFLVLAAWLRPGIPGPLIAVIGATAAVVALGLQSAGVDVVGEIPTGVPPIGLPAIGLADLPLLAASAVGVAVVGVHGRHPDRAGLRRSARLRDRPQRRAPRTRWGEPGGRAHGRDARQQFRLEDGDRRQRRRPQHSWPGSWPVSRWSIVLIALGGLLARFPSAALGGLVVFAGLRLIDVGGAAPARPLPTERARAGPRRRGRRASWPASWPASSSPSPCRSWTCSRGVARPAAGRAGPGTGRRRPARHHRLPGCGDHPRPGRVPLRRAAVLRQRE